MSKTNRTDYNLRPRPDQISLPIQIHLSDTDLMSHLAQDSQPTPGQGQGRGEDMSDSDSIDSNLLNGSDPDGNASDNDMLGNESNPRVNEGASTSSELSTQDLINQRILDQLNAIGTRLDKLEKSDKCKKTSDKSKTKNKDVETRRQGKQPDRSQVVNHSTVSNTFGNQNSTLPALNTLRHDSTVQKQIEERIKELSNQSGMEKIKSLRGGKLMFMYKNGCVGLRNLY